MRNLKLLCICTVLSFLIKIVHAGVIDTQLKDRLSAASADEEFSILIRVSDRVDISSLKAELKAKKAELAVRHKKIIESLRENAEKSQKDIIGYLVAAKNSGRVTDFRPFWISNLIWVKAPGSEIETIAKRQDVEVVFLYVQKLHVGIFGSTDFRVFEVGLFRLA